MKPRAAPDLRKRELAIIHVAKAQLRMDDDTYRNVLWTVGRVRSSADLDQVGRELMIKHFKSCGWMPSKKRVKTPNAAQAKKPLISKIGAMLADSGRPWEYADGIARHMFPPIEKAAWCDVAQLRKIVAALNYDAKRKQGENG